MLLSGVSSQGYNADVILFQVSTDSRHDAARLYLVAFVAFRIRVRKEEM